MASPANQDADSLGQKESSGEKLLGVATRHAGLARRRDDGWLGILLVAAIFATYSPVWWAGFIWDDDAHITQPLLRSWNGLWRIWFEPGAVQQYYPLLHSLFWIEYHLWGEWPLPYHLVNVLVFSASTLVLVSILRRLEVSAAWLAGGIFALHPLQVESVAWVAESKNIISGLFYFLAALAYLDFDRTRKWGPYCRALLFFIFGLLSKSAIVSLPVALLVVFWWKRGRLSWKRDVIPLLPFFLIGTASGLVTIFVEKHLVGAQGGAFDFSLTARTLIAGRDIWFYLSKLFWPAQLIFIYPRWNIDESAMWQYLFPLAAGLLGIALFMLRHRWRGPLAGYFFYIATLFPALGYFNVYPFRFSFVADHFQYLASLGIIVPCAVGFSQLFKKLRPWPTSWLPVAGGVSLLGLLAVISWSRAWVFGDAERLWLDTLAQNPSCWLAETNLGIILLDQGNRSTAQSHFQAAVDLNPTYSTARFYLGNILRQEGKFDEAIVQFQKAVDCSPRFVQAYNDLALTLAQKGDMEGAVKNLQNALAIDPNQPEVCSNLGAALFQVGRVDEAISEFQKALTFDPNLIDVRINLARALTQQGHWDEAITQYQQVLAIAPNQADVHMNLGLVFFHQGRLDEAVGQLQQAVALDPNNTTARNYLGQVLAKAQQVQHP